MCVCLCMCVYVCVCIIINNLVYFVVFLCISTVKSEKQLEKPKEQPEKSKKQPEKPEEQLEKPEKQPEIDESKLLVILLVIRIYHIIKKACSPQVVISTFVFLRSSYLPSRFVYNNDY